MRRPSIYLALGLLAACSKSTPTPTGNAAPSASITPAAAPASAASAIVDPSGGFDAKSTLRDGTSIVYRSAVVYQYQGSNAKHFVVGTEKLTCADVIDNDDLKLKPKEDRVELVISPLLRADGTTAPAVMQLFHFTNEGTESLAVGKYADAQLAGEDPTRPIRATVSGYKAENAGLTAFAGTFLAASCGAVKGPEQEEDAPKPRPQANLSLEVAKKKLEVRGAVYWPGRNLLVLSTRAQGCSTTAIESEVDVYLSDDGSTGRLGGFGISPVDNTDLSKGPKVELGKAQKELVPAKINGTFQLGAYSVTIAGSAELLSCE